RSPRSDADRLARGPSPLARAPASDQTSSRAEKVDVPANPKMSLGTIRVKGLDRRPLAEGVDDEAVRAKKLEDLVRSQPELVDRLGPLGEPEPAERSHEPLVVAELRLEGEHLEAGAERAREHGGGVPDVGPDVEDVAAAEQIRTPARQGRERVSQALVREVRP